MMWIAIIVWVVMFLITSVLTVVSLATSYWVEFTHSSTESDLTRGLFHSTTRHPPSCNLSDGVFNVAERAYEDYRVGGTAALLIIGIFFDLLCLFCGVLHFRARAKAKQKLWVRSIPTILTALSAAVCVLSGCLVFLLDLKNNEGPWMDAGLTENCTFQAGDIHISTTYGFSFTLAIVSGAVMIAKTLLFSIIACGC